MSDSIPIPYHTQKHLARLVWDINMILYTELLWPFTSDNHIVVWTEGCGERWGHRQTVVR